MAGYAVECVLKACIAKQTQQYDYPDKKTVENSYTHNVEHLLKTAKIEDDFKVYRKGNPDFGTNWDIVKDWSENSRYETHTQSEAENLLTAIIDSKSGVLQWIQRYW